MSRNAHPSIPRAGSRESGSAYLLTLAVLVVLSIVGLSLAVVTQSEMLVGAGDRMRERTFYAADSGLGVATARALAQAEYEATSYELVEDDVTPGLDIKNDIDVTPFVPMLTGPCNLCEVNAAGPGQQYGAKSYWKVTHGVAVQATRQGGAAQVPLSQVTISAMVDVEPWEDFAEALLPIMDDVEIAKIKY